MTVEPTVRDYLEAGLGGRAVATALAGAVGLTFAFGLGSLVVRQSRATPAAAVEVDLASGRPTTVASAPPPPTLARSPAPSVPRGDPVRIRIPSIGVTAPLVRLGLATDGTLEVPRFEDAGWYTGRSRPGEPGPSVIAAHFDSTTGPAVFYRLRELAPGAEILVDYREGTVRFVSRSSESFEKNTFPTSRVYGPTIGPELRLITCEGRFDRRTRSYQSNLVVWAAPA